MEAMPKIASISLSIPALIHSTKGPHYPGARLEIHNLNSEDESPYSQWTDQLARCSETLRGLSTYFIEFCDDNNLVIDICTKLHQLNLFPSSTDSKCDQVFCLINLEGLEIDCRNCTETTLSDISKLKGLKRLNLHKAQSISEQFLREPGTISTLRYLDLVNCELNVSVIRSLGSLKNLRGLSLSLPESGGVHSDCFDAICGNLENLEELSVVDHSYLTDEDGIRLRRLENLKKLSLDGADKLTDVTFEGGLGSSSLTELELTNCPFTNAGLVGIASNHKMLRIISLTRCHKITDDGFISLLERETLLQDLFVKDCSSLDGRWIKRLGALCPRLRYLIVEGYEDLSELSEFEAKRPVVAVWP